MSAGRSLPGSPLANGPAVAHLRIGDHQGGFVQDRRQFRNQVRASQLMLRGHRSDQDAVAVAADSFEAINTVQVDQVVGRGEPQLHHRNEAVAAGERARLAVKRGKQFDCIGHRRWPMIDERTRNHGALRAQADRVHEV